MQQVHTNSMQSGLPAQGRAENTPAWRILSGSTLKIIACVTMLIDHCAAGILGRYLSMRGGNDLDWADMNAYQQWAQQNETLFGAYNLMRDIGRVAFPIYCFLLIEGFLHTKSRSKYAGRLLIFAFISEIPFDLLFQGKILYFGYQNIFFTLFLGMAAMIGIDWAVRKGQMAKPFRAVSACAAAAVCIAVADILHTDYGAQGVLCIIVMFLFQKCREMQVAVGACSFLFFLEETAAPYAFLSIAMYNGKRGWNLKYFFYLFYPVHLLLLYLASVALGISAYASW